MKIFIRTEERNINIILPTSLFLNRLSASITVKIVKSKQPYIDISADDFMEIVNFIKQYKKKHKYWEVVNISSANGEKVFISI